MITYNKRTHIFRLETEHTTYAFRALRGKRAEHLYYGKKCGRILPMPQLPLNYGFSPNDADTDFLHSHDFTFAEYPGYGAGDFRSPAVRILGKSGTGVTDFRFVGHRIYDGRPVLEGLPFPRGTTDCQTLEICLKDSLNGCKAFLSYTVYPAFDIITRSVTLENAGRSAITVEQPASLSFELPGRDYEQITLAGSYHTDRFNLERHPLGQGTHRMISRRGASGHQLNPFFALVSPETEEKTGDVYAFNFVYSGGFTNTVEITPHGATRVQIAADDENFAWLLEKGEKLTLPEAVMLYTNRGLGEMRHQMHAFIDTCILPPLPEGTAPLVLNTWEGTWFSIDEEKLLHYADAAKGTGIDTLVMDDGWFGARIGDDAGLGDWFVNRNKFPEGLAHTVRCVKERGLKFGIWIEPEMVNPDSDLYRAHPEYALTVPGKEPALSRKQLVLDMGNTAVIDYLKKSLSETFAGCDIAYFKWDFNRHICDAYSHVLPAKRQRETKFRFMRGTYALLDWLRKTWPNAILETCSGGGGRYDLGMMVYGHQIWTSDNTNPGDRIRIQSASLLAYPARTMSCHVANGENVCEGNPRTMRFRYAVAAAGALGYEFNLALCSDEVVKTVKAQVAEYKTYAHLMQSGRYDEYLSPFTSPLYAYAYLSDDRREILLTALADKADTGRYTVYPDADERLSYRDTLSGKVYNGKELRRGLTLCPDGKDEWSMMLHLMAV